MADMVSCYPTWRRCTNPWPSARPPLPCGRGFQTIWGFVEGELVAVSNGAGARLRSTEPRPKKRSSPQNRRSSGTCVLPEKVLSETGVTACDPRIFLFCKRPCGFITGVKSTAVIFVGFRRDAMQPRCDRFIPINLVQLCCPRRNLSWPIGAMGSPFFLIR